MPCQYAAPWLLDLIQPLSSAIKDKREGNAQNLASCLRVLHDLEQIADLERQGGGYRGGAYHMPPRERARREAEQQAERQAELQAERQAERYHGDGYHPPPPPLPQPTARIPGGWIPRSAIKGISGKGSSLT